jgi:hypothetical protein
MSVQPRPGRFHDQGCRQDLCFDGDEDFSQGTYSTHKTSYSSYLLSPLLQMNPKRFGPHLPYHYAPRFFNLY